MKRYRVTIKYGDRKVIVDFTRKRDAQRAVSKYRASSKAGSITIEVIMRTIIIFLLVTSYLLPMVGYADDAPSFISDEEMHQIEVRESLKRAHALDEDNARLRDQARSPREESGGVVGLSVNGAVCQEKLSNSNKAFHIVNEQKRGLESQNQDLQKQVEDAKPAIPGLVWFIIGGLAGGAGAYFGTRSH